MNWIYVLTGLFFVAVIMTIAYFIYNTHVNIASNESMANQNQQYSQVMEQITELKQRESQAGPQGPQGIQGQQGPAGGTFTRQGVLRNLAYPKNVSDRYYGTGNNVGLYLNNPNYSSNQTWILTSDSLLQNQYGGCVDYTGSNVFMNTCNKSTATQRWTHDANGRISSANQCLTTFQKVPAKSVPRISNQKPSTSTSASEIGVMISPCDSQKFPLNQQWAFY